jgi:hypothetical protein
VAAREALLKAEYREWYPKLVPGIWYDAEELTAQVLEQQRTGEPKWAFEGRVPSEAHFLFRGGLARRPGEAYSRRTDSG